MALPVVTSRLDLSEPSQERGGSRSLRAFVARPDGEGPWPAVVMVMEIFGVNGDMRGHAERIASWGHLVVVPDLYSDGGARRCLVSTMQSLERGEGRAFTDIETARQWAVSRPETTDAVGIIGFCMGGGFALLTCDRDRYDVASANYGAVPDDLTRSCPVVGSYGGRDRQLPDAARVLGERLEAAGVEHDVREYAGAGHSFLNDGLPGPRLLAPLLHLAGLGGDEADREDAWRRIEEFFASHLH